MITPSKFREIAEYLDNRTLLTNFMISKKEEMSREAMLFDQKDSVKLGESNVGTLDVIGNLTCKSTGFEALCGGASYEQLIDTMKSYAKDPDINTVIMNLDSGGGEAYRMMESSKELRKIADDNNMELIGYVDGLCASAAIGLGSACHRLIANPDAKVGSIGVVVSLTNDSEHLEKEGFKRVFITAGEDKVPFDKEGNFTENFISNLQSDVDAMYDKFVNHMAEMRNLDVETIRNTEARVFRSEDALSLGLIDEIMTISEFNTYLSGKSQNKENTTSASSQSVLIKSEKLEKEDITMSNEVNMETFLAMQAELEAMKAEKLEAKQLEVQEHLSSVSFLSEELQGSLVGFLMSSEVTSSHKELLNTVIESANSYVTSEVALYTEAKEEALKEVETVKQEAAAEIVKVNAEKDKIKEEFGLQASEASKVEQECSTELGTTATLDTKAIIKAKVAHAKKLNK